MNQLELLLKQAGFVQQESYWDVSSVESYLLKTRNPSEYPIEVLLSTQTIPGVRTAIHYKTWQRLQNDSRLFSLVDVGQVIPLKNSDELDGAMKMFVSLGQKSSLLVVPEFSQERKQVGYQVYLFQN